MIPVLLNLRRFILWLGIWANLETIMCLLEKKYILLILLCLCVYTLTLFVCVSQKITCRSKEVGFLLPFCVCWGSKLRSSGFEAKKKKISLYPLSHLTNPHSAYFIGNILYRLIKSIWFAMLIKFTISLFPIWMFYPLLNVEYGSLQKWLHSFAEVFKLFKQNTISVLFAFSKSNILLLSSLMKCLPCNAKFMQASVSIASSWPLLTVLV